jgi:hypothetical protein
VVGLSRAKAAFAVFGKEDREERKEGRKGWRLGSCNPGKFRVGRAHKVLTL